MHGNPLGLRIFGVRGGFLVASFALVNALVLLPDEDSWSTLFDSLENFSDDFRECDRGAVSLEQLRYACERIRKILRQRIICST